MLLPAYRPNCIFIPITVDRILYPEELKNENLQ